MPQPFRILCIVLDITLLPDHDLVSLTLNRTYCMHLRHTLDNLAWTGLRDGGPFGANVTDVEAAPAGRGWGHGMSH